MEGREAAWTSQTTGWRLARSKQKSGKELSAASYIITLSIRDIFLRLKFVFSVSCNSYCKTMIQTLFPANLATLPAAD